MVITIINDCQDSNASGRQIARIASLLNSPTAFIGVRNDLEASGNLIDALDAAAGRASIILVNVAPRNGPARKWGNGTPFCYFRFKKTLVIATIDGVTLSLTKKLHLVRCVNLLDVPKTLDALAKNGNLPTGLQKHIINSQFRSYDFFPYIAALLSSRKNIQAVPFELNKIPDVPPAVWWVDSFGNCKTTVLPEEIIYGADRHVTTKFGKLPYYSRLKDVPDDTAALIIGSSGIRSKRFIEIVIQGGSAAQRFKLSSGDPIF